MLKKIKVYMPFAANELKGKMAYKGAFYLFMVIGLFSSFITYFLWMAIYGSTTQSTLGGFTQNEMMIYVFMTYVTSSIVTITISDWVSEDVVKGTVAMQLIKPIDYRMSLIARALGGMVYQFLAPAIWIWIGVEIYKVTILGMTLTSISRITFYLLSCLMSFLIYVLFDFCFGMIAFFTTYIFGMLMVKNALLSFLTGQLIPLSFFPDSVQKLFELLPFSSMVYTPIMIYLGKYNQTELIFVLMKQVVWIVILYLLGSLIWRQVTKRLVVLGG